MASTNSIERGREAVRTALIDAASEMLAEVGPNAMSVRSVAIRAGVNHGQVHHYFGNKQGLIEAAAHKLAAEHYAHARERSGGTPLPKPLTLGEDSAYLMALVRLVLDGHLDTATREIEDGISVPVEFRKHVTQHYSAASVPIEVKAQLALMYATELGWSALEPYVRTLADVRDEELVEVREIMRTLAHKQRNKLMRTIRTNTSQSRDQQNKTQN